MKTFLDARRLALPLVLGLASVLPLPALAASAADAPAARPTLVLVHGAFADGSSWSRVIPPLEAAGYTTIAVQNPMNSFADDVATTRRVIEAQKGPVVVVGHSYGGAVMTRAAAGAANVKALVYVAAFAPDDQEVVGALLAKFPSALGTALVPDAAGFVYVDRARFGEIFAGDLPEKEQLVLAVTQTPISGATFEQKHGAPAWKEAPSWYLVATKDQVINPELQRFFARRMKAQVREVETSHVPFLSRPEVVVEVIKAAIAGARR